MKTRDICLSPENQITLIVVTFDSKLDFVAHTHKACKEASGKLNGFLEIANHLNFVQKNVPMNS